MPEPRPVPRPAPRPGPHPASRPGPRVPADRLARRALLPLAGAALAGCKLVDQTTFWPPPPPPPPPKVVPPPPPPPPLVTIDLNQPGLAYAGPLRQAIAAARARKPDVEFSVVGVGPAGASTAAQLAALRQAQQDAHDVADAVAKLGVAPAQIRLSARTEPGVKGREVRVYVR